VIDDHDDVHDLEAGATGAAGSQGRHFRWWIMLDVVQCIPQETAPGWPGKGRIGARLISHADNTALAKAA